MTKNTDNQLMIRNITIEDLQAISDIHLRAFPGSALTKLGLEAVRRYYHWQLTGPHESYSIIAIDNQQIAGFCFGGVFHGALSGFLRINQAFLVRRVMSHPWLLFNELFRSRVKSALLSLKIIRMRKKQSLEVSENKPKSYGILSIAVDPQIQSRGIGRALMLAAENDAIEKGFEQMHLTVSPKNLQAIKFYAGLGWVKKNEPWSGSMIKYLR
jgi:ribosomal protein S18 acetylase RimI-like enzyme